MLSGETATGKYPVESVLMMKQIAEITEQALPYDWSVSYTHLTLPTSDLV